MVGSKYWIPKHQNHQDTKLLLLRYKRILTNQVTYCLQMVTRQVLNLFQEPVEQEVGFFYRGKIEVSLRLKLCQKTKIKKPNFSSHPW